MTRWLNDDRAHVWWQGGFSAQEQFPGISASGWRSKTACYRPRKPLFLWTGRIKSVGYPWKQTNGQNFVHAFRIYSCLLTSQNENKIFISLSVSKRPVRPRKPAFSWTDLLKSASRPWKQPFSWTAPSKIVFHPWKLCVLWMGRWNSVRKAVCDVHEPANLGYPCGKSSSRIAGSKRRSRLICWLEAL